MPVKKVVNPCMCDTYNGEKRAFAEIEFKEGRLSICGVIGPKSNGDAFGSCGQCVDEIRAGKPAEGWNEEMVQKFCDIWDEWHLNDMRAYCPHMKELGWTEHLSDKVKVETWTLTREAADMKKKAENRALECLRNRKRFDPTEEEWIYANMPFSVKVYDGEDEPYANSRYRGSYELKEKDVFGLPNIEYKTRGWISVEDHKLGFLGKPCPICGYKYGTAWKREEVPQDVIEWLFSLPKSKVAPAWV